MTTTPRINPGEPYTTTWRHQAACRGLDTQLFYPGKGRPTPPAAINACAQCPVVEACWQDAVTVERGIGHETFGYRAGLTAQQRIRKARAAGTPTRRRAPVALCGTDGGYHAHRTKNEPTCEPCRQAHNVKAVEWKAKRRQGADTPTPPTNRYEASELVTIASKRHLYT